jgi:hypothetical protein
MGELFDWKKEDTFGALILLFLANIALIFIPTSDLIKLVLWITLFLIIMGFIFLKKSTSKKK